MMTYNPWIAHESPKAYISNGVHSGMRTVKILAHRTLSMSEQSEVEII